MREIFTKLKYKNLTEATIEMILTREKDSPESIAKAVSEYVNGLPENDAEYADFYFTMKLGEKK